jgi:hypothetical protein
MTRLAAAPLTVILLALGLVACGGDDAPSQADFAKSAEKICADQAKQLQNLGKASSPDEFAEQLDKAIDATRSSIDDLGELDRPEGDAGKKAEQFVNAVETDIEKKGLPVLEDLRDGIKANDQKAVQDAYKKLTALQTTDSSKLAKEIGAESCAD